MSKPKTLKPEVEATEIKSVEPELTEIQIKAKDLLEKLPGVESPLVLTQDELVCIRLIREACEDILKGGDISPAAPGVHKRRLIRRVSVGFFVADAPRPRQVINP